MKIPTQSFTLRMPEDLLREIERQAGKGKRSEFIIDTLRAAVGKDAPVGSDRTIVEVQLQLEIFKTETEANNKNLSSSIDRILERLDALESSQSKTNRKTKSTARIDITESKTESSANLNLAENQNPYILETTGQKEGELKLPGMDDQSIENTYATITETELIEILKAAEPGGKWRIQKMIERRRPGKDGKQGSIDRLHSVGVHRFKYKTKEILEEGGKPVHTWLYNLTQ
jgi:ribosome-associated translation inhibitor RaiA